jgi:hypothetical protein
MFNEILSIIFSFSFGSKDSKEVENRENEENEDDVENSASISNLNEWGTSTFPLFASLLFS